MIPIVTGTLIGWVQKQEMADDKNPKPERPPIIERVLYIVSQEIHHQIGSSLVW